MSCSRRLGGNVTSGPTFTCQWQQQGHVTPASSFASLIGHFYLALFSALQHTFNSQVMCNLDRMIAALYNVFEWPLKRCTFSADRWWHGCLSLAGTATSITFVVTKICCNKHVFVTTEQFFVVAKLLSQQNDVCHDKCSSQQKFCREKNVCCDKGFVVTYFCHSKRCVLSRQIRVLLHPVATKLLSRQNYFCSNNYL